MGTFFAGYSGPVPAENASAGQGTVLSSQDYLAQTKYYVEAAYEEARMDLGQSTDVNDVARYIDYIIGSQWPKGRPSYKSRPTNNRIWRLFWELVALLTDMRPFWDVYTMNDAFTQTAKIINNVSKAWWMEGDCDVQLALVVIYALLTTGYGKLEWNDRLRNGDGDMQLIALGPTSVLPLKPRLNIQDCEALFYQTIMPLQFFRRKYKNTGQLVQADPSLSRYNVPAKAPAHLPPMVFNMLTDAMKRTVGIPGYATQSVVGMALYREMWMHDDRVNETRQTLVMGRGNWAYRVLPGQPIYPRGRLIVMGGSTVLDDIPNPYWHGWYPFGCLRMNQVPWQFHGISELRPLVELQDIVNNILAGVMDMVKKAVNPGFVAPKNAFSEEMWARLDWSAPGTKAAYSPLAGHQPQWQPQPQLPGFVLTTAQMAMREMDASSGIASVDEATRKKQIPGADTLEQIKQTQQTPLRLKGRNIESFLRVIGQMSIYNMFQFYDTKRRYWLMGEKGVTAQDLDWDPGNMKPAGVDIAQHARNFIFQIRPGSMLNSDRMQKVQLALALRKAGDIDRKTLYEILDMGINVEDVNKNLAQEAAQRTLPGLLKQLGGNPPPMPGQPAPQ